MSRSGSHVPLRTCVSCRSKKSKKDLVRLALDDENRVVIDYLQNMNGRGIYLCDNAPCRLKFKKYKGIGRFFRTDKPVSINFEI